VDIAHSDTRSQKPISSFTRVLLRHILLVGPPNAPNEPRAAAPRCHKTHGASAPFGCYAARCYVVRVTYKATEIAFDTIAARPGRVRILHKTSSCHLGMPSQSVRSVYNQRDPSRRSALERMEDSYCRRTPSPCHSL